MHGSTSASLATRCSMPYSSFAYSAYLAADLRRHLIDHFVPVALFGAGLTFSFSHPVFYAHQHGYPNLAIRRLRLRRLAMDASTPSYHLTRLVIVRASHLPAWAPVVIYLPLAGWLA